MEAMKAIGMIRTICRSVVALPILITVVRIVTVKLHLELIKNSCGFKELCLLQLQCITSC